MGYAMAGVYGEFLGSFSELFEDFKIYKYETDTVSGYKLTYDRTIRAIKQTVLASVIPASKNKLPVLSIGKQYYFRSCDKLDIATDFVEIEGEMYRLMKQSAFNREGGYWETVIEQVVGNDGTARQEPELDDGVW